jgi:hypothetical protein
MQPFDIPLARLAASLVFAVDPDPATRLVRVAHGHS